MKAKWRVLRRAWTPITLERIVLVMANQKMNSRLCSILLRSPVFPSLLAPIASSFKGSDVNTNLSALSAGLRGIQRGMKGLQQEAQNVAQATADGSAPVELAESLVNTLQHQRGIQASAKVIQRADETLGSLIDMLA